MRNDLTIEETELELVDCDCHLLETRCHTAKLAGKNKCAIFKRKIKPVLVSLEKCAKELSARTLARFQRSGFTPEQDYNHWKQEYLDSAKAVLDAAGVKYVD